MGEKLKCFDQQNGGKRCQILMAHIKVVVDQWWKEILEIGDESKN